MIRDPLTLNGVDNLIHIWDEIAADPGTPWESRCGLWSAIMKLEDACAFIHHGLLDEAAEIVDDAVDEGLRAVRVARHHTM